MRNSVWQEGQVEGGQVMPKGAQECCRVLCTLLGKRLEGTPIHQLPCMHTKELMHLPKPISRGNCFFSVSSGAGGWVVVGKVSATRAVSSTSSNALTLFRIPQSSRFSCSTVSVSTGGTSAPFTAAEQ